MALSPAAPEPGEGRFLDGGGLHSVPGMRGGALGVGLKDSGNPDLAVIAAEEPLQAAGRFTLNRLPAAPVQLCRRMLADSARASCVVINSGNANALTGRKGLEHAERMRTRSEAHFGGPALVLSTGVIGVPLPIGKVEAGLDRLKGRLGSEALREVPAAMLTTDTCTKQCALELELPEEDGDPARRVTIGGAAKGSGMIHPRMGTMLAVIGSEAVLAEGRADALLGAAVDRSFHCITVDGDTSTNDSVLLLAGGAAMPALRPEGAREALFARGLRRVARELALQIVRDGEGAARMARIAVEGAESHAEARQVALAIATSSLVKTALAGGDPNWGRILAAAANAGVALQEDSLHLELGDHTVYTRGAPQAVDTKSLSQTFAAEQVEIRLRLGKGPGNAWMATTDLSRRYVEINSEYTT